MQAPGVEPSQGTAARQEAGVYGQPQTPAAHGTPMRR